MTLAEGNVGQVYTVLNSALPQQVEKRMEALGMTRGSQLRVLHKKNSGTLVILLRGTRFAVGRGLTSNIQVKEASEWKTK
nr:FeoA family protein [Bacilliculturomica massiliensis]